MKLAQSGAVRGVYLQGLADSPFKGRSDPSFAIEMFALRLKDKSVTTAQTDPLTF